MNILKSVSAIATAFVMVLSTTLLNAQEEAPKVSAYLIKANGAYQRVVVMGSNNKKKIFYKENPNAIKTISSNISDFSGIWLFEPKDVTAAKDLFEARKYQEAKAAFIALQDRYKNYKYLSDSYFEISQFYEMECYRKLNDYETLTKKLEFYKPERLTRPWQVRQAELYKMYEAVHKQDWSRLDTLCKDYVQDTGMTLGQRAQVAFCQGIALEGLKQNDDALNAYATAMTVDFTRSESTVRQAALNSLRIFEADEEVKTAIELWGTDKEKKTSKGYAKLMEANALARLYDKAGLGSGVKLPANLKKLQKYNPQAVIKKEAPKPAQKKKVK